MGIRKIVWTQRATDNFSNTFIWYREQCGRQFAQSFYCGILDTIETLSQMPTIGILDKRRSTEKTQYYSFLAHPKYRIIYRFTARRIYIVAIHATLMKYSGN